MAFYGTWGSAGGIQSQKRKPTSDPFALAWGGHGRPGQVYAPPAPTQAPAPGPSPIAPQQPGQTPQGLQLPDYRTDPAYLAGMGALGTKLQTETGRVNLSGTRGKEDLATALSNYQDEYGLGEKTAKDQLQQNLAELAFRKPGDIRQANRSAHAAGLAFSSELNQNLGDIDQSYSMQEHGLKSGYQAQRDAAKLGLQQFLAQNKTQGTRLDEDTASALKEIQGVYGEKGTEAAALDKEALDRAIAWTIAHPPAPTEQGSAAPAPPAAAPAPTNQINPQLAAAIAKLPPGTKIKRGPSWQRR